MKLECKQCNHINSPQEKLGDLICKNCKTPYSYFQKTMYKNEKNKQRVAEERAKNNNSVTKSYRLKK